MSVDGVEVVASLVLLADRRVGRRSSWLVWAALMAGTGASMAANVAVGAADPIGRVVAGWPAFALLLAIKLLSGLAEHPVPPSAAAGPAVLVQPTSVTVEPLRDTGPRRRSPSHGPRRAVAAGRTGPHRAPAVEVADLVPVARTALADVIAGGGRITRPLLAERLRSSGVAVSNSRASELLRLLKAETAVADRSTTDQDGDP